MFIKQKKKIHLYYILEGFLERQNMVDDSDLPGTEQVWDHARLVIELHF